MEQNREVMVVPGSALSSQYRGSHQLIQQGAALVMSAHDVLFCVAPELAASIEKTSEEKFPDTPSKKHPLARVLDCIGAESTSVDEIILGSGLTAAEVSSMLIMLELEGVVSRLGDGGYINLR
jgi:DNA processing protein